MDIFYPAEDYHQDYYKNNSNQPYCSIVIHPKIKKFEKMIKKKWLLLLLPKKFVKLGGEENSTFYN